MNIPADPSTLEALDIVDLCAHVRRFVDDYDPSDRSNLAYAVRLSSALLQHLEDEDRVIEAGPGVSLAIAVELDSLIKWSTKWFHVSTRGTKSI